jgi:uncharacterized protein
MLMSCWVLAQAPAPSIAADPGPDRYLNLELGKVRLQAMVARTPAERMVGLMYRNRLDDDQGMLFVFPDTALHAMWMKNTALPLAVAFIDAQGVIINIEEMTPHTLDAHAAARPAKYALETKAGWFAKHAVAPGSKIKGLERAPAPE